MHDPTPSLVVDNSIQDEGNEKMVYDIPKAEVDTDMYQVMEMERSVLLQDDVLHCNGTIEIVSTSNKAQHSKPIDEVVII